MFTLLRLLPWQRLVIEQLPAFAIAWLIAESFYKWRSFSLEMLGFLVTWLAALRRGLGQPAGSAHEMYRYIVPWLGEKSTAAQEDLYFLLASLFAYHPQPGGKGNHGCRYDSRPFFPYVHIAAPISSFLCRL